MTMETFSLLSAIAWGVVVGVGTVALGQLRRSFVSARSAGTGAGTTPGVTISDLIVGAILGAATYVAALVVCHLTIRFTVFGTIAITYLVLVIGVPLALAIVLLGAAGTRNRSAATDGPSRKLASRPALALCIAGLLLAPIGIYATHIEPSLLDVERPEPLVVAAERAGDDPLTIGVLTDLQTPVIGDRERAVVDELMASRPDIILLPGDIIQGSDELFDAQLPALHELLGRLEAPGGVYLVGGDVDKPLDRLSRMVEGTTVRYLDNEVATTTVGDRSVTVGGMEVDYTSTGSLDLVDQLETAPGDDDIRILLSHRPDPVLALEPDSRIDLQVSGHTHGGQVAVPFVGPLMTLSSVPRSIGAGGLHDLGGNAIYVGRGVGLERGNAPQVRFGVRPNIGVLTISG